MRLDRYINQNRIINLKSTDYESALTELLGACPLKNNPSIPAEDLLNSLLERESTVTACLDNGIAVPHIRLPIKQPYILAVGRCPNGVEYKGVAHYKSLKIIILLLISDKEDDYLNTLSALARQAQESPGGDALADTSHLTEFKERIKILLGAPPPPVHKTRTRFNHLMLKQAEKVAEGADCSTILVFADTFTNTTLLDTDFSKFKTIIVTEQTNSLYENYPEDAIIIVRSFSDGRLAQLRSAIIIGLTRGLFQYNDRLCCISGIQHSNQFDTLVVLDLEREFQSVFTRKLDLLPQSVKPEVVERVLAIATELAVEGREGRAVGTLFVVGDTEHVKPFAKPLVINPFYGYKEDDCNILNPFMDETVKEFSCIDGAFIIHGNGVIESCGSFIHASNHDYQLPGGLGTRHSAAAAISLVTDCLAVVVSSSSRQVTLFRKGQMLPLIDKGHSPVF